MRLTVLYQNKLYLYCWQGIDQHGQTQSGEDNAKSKHQLQQKLSQQGIFSTDIRRSKSTTNLHLNLKTKHWLRLIEQWLYGLQSQLAISDTLAMLLKQTRKDDLYQLNHHCYQQVLSGHSLGHALQAITFRQSSWVIKAITTAEHQGDLARVLNEVHQQLKQQQQLKQSLQKALFYPMTVLLLSLLITLGLLIFIVPQFESLYQQMNAQLPVLTQALVQISSWLKQYGITIFSGTFICTILLGVIVKRHSGCKHRIHQIALHCPLIGSLILHHQLARWHALLHVMLDAGIALDQTLSIISDCLSHHHFQHISQNLAASVHQGLPLCSQTAVINRLPNLDQQLIYIGENTGQLSSICLYLSQHHQRRLNQFSEAVSQWLEPALMMVLAVLIGGLVVALYAPLLKLGSLL